MTRVSRTAAPMAVVMAGLRMSGVTYAALCCAGQSAVAAPVAEPSVRASVASPSVQMAADLANHPRGWIGHYLPADRYKIKGGVWKFVSTETDTQYHRPDSPLMLRQSPDIVIGFASAADAEEGGYQPGPSITLHDRQSRSGPGSFTRNNRRTFGGATTPNTGTPGAIIPDTGFGTVTVPVAAIPKDIRDFIQLVDGLAAEIEAASTPTELYRIRRRIRLAGRGDMAQSGMAHMSGDREGGNTRGSMAAVLQVLERAVDAKLHPNPAGIPEDQQLLSAARSGARALIPQVQAQFRQQVERNRREMLRRPVR